MTTEWDIIKVTDLDGVDEYRVTGKIDNGPRGERSREWIGKHLHLNGRAFHVDGEAVIEHAQVEKPEDPAVEGQIDITL